MLLDDWGLELQLVLVWQSEAAAGERERDPDSAVPVLPGFRP